MMARIAARVTCSAVDFAELERLSASRTEQARLVERARIVLRCVAGERNDAIGARLGLQANTVATWRKRFLTHGSAGLQDRPRSGKPTKYAPVSYVSASSNNSNCPPPMVTPVGMALR